MNTEHRNAQDFPRAMDFLRQGRFVEAISIYEAILRRDPRNIAAANLLGIALIQTGRLEDAVAAIGRALEIDPNQASAQYNLGSTLQALGRHEAAIGHFKEALRLNPKDAQTHNNLGAAFKALGRMEDALEAYRAAIELQPDFFEAHLNAGNALHALGRSFEGLETIDRAIKLQPSRPEGYLCAGSIMGAIDFEDRAIPHFREALRLGSNAVSTYFKLAECLYSTKAHEEALAVAEQGFKKEPVTAEDYASIGVFLQKLNRNEEAVAYFKRAVELDPNHMPAHLGLVHSLDTLGRISEAEKQHEMLRALHPAYKKAIYNRGLMYLAEGRFQKGWSAYEERFSEEVDVKITASRNFSFPLWNGSKTGTLLIWAEQGLGDQIIYSSIIGNAMERVDDIVLEVEPRLVPLMARSFPLIRVIPLCKDQQEVQADAHLPISILGKFFRNDWQDFPCKPYLTADESRARHLRESVRDGDRCIIGLSWRSANLRIGEYKTAKLQDFFSVLSRPELGFVDLQYGDTAEEIAAVSAKSGILVRHLDEIDNTNDIDGLAALIEACDAVLTVSNTTAHIAGALGKPVWILVPHGQGRLWYWFRDRKDSPWYPGARIVRQQSGQPWADLVASITPEIVAFAKERKSRAG